MSSLPIRSLRLQKRAADSLDRLGGNSGELFYDADNRTLRLYTGDGADRIIFATRTWVNQTIAAEAFSGSYDDLTDLPVLFSGDYNDLTNTPSIPTVTTTYVSAAPASSVGQAGDVAGMIFADSSFVYVCYAQYDGVSSIWTRTAADISPW